MNTRRTSNLALGIRAVVVVAATAILPVIPAAAQGGAAPNYPVRPITLIVPFAAGGPTDVLARLLGERVRAALGQPVLIENVTGAGGSIGVGRVAAAAPDGYTIGTGHFGTHVANGAVYPLKYDLLHDLDPVALLPSNPMVVVVRKNFPAADLKGLTAWLKANPGRAAAGTAGAGSGAHIAAAFLAQAVGTTMQYVPYRGTAPALQDLVSGQIDLMVDQAANALPQIRQGSVRALAVTAGTRLAAAPDIPTTDEAGLSFHMEMWNGMWAPHGTPRAIVDKLNGVVAAALSDPAIRQRLATLGLDGPPADKRSPEALGALQKAEAEKWWPIIKAARISAE